MNTTSAYISSLTMIDDLVALSNNLSNCLDKRTGGEISGTVGIVQHNLKILSGNYILTTTPNAITSYDSKNTFVHADGNVVLGSNGFCISKIIDDNTIQLSGDISLLTELMLLTASNIPSTIKKNVLQDTNDLSNALFSILLSAYSGSMCFLIESIDKTTGKVRIKEKLSDAGFNTGVLSTMSPEQLLDAFFNDDNAFYLVGFPEVGNIQVANFFGQHVEGNSGNAIGKYTHAEGLRSIADSRYSHSEGALNIAGDFASHAEGKQTCAKGKQSHTEGYDTLASASLTHAEGNATKATANQAHAEGNGTTASGSQSHSEGYNTTASASQTHAEGNNTKATANQAHAEGNSTTASGKQSHAEGVQTEASGSQTHAEGYMSYAIGAVSHAEGSAVSAVGDISHAEGEGTLAQGKCSHASGKGTVAGGEVLKGYAFALVHIYADENKIALATSLNGGTPADFAYKVGDVISYINDKEYPSYSIIQQVIIYAKSAAIVVDRLPFTTVDSKAYIYCASKPTSGAIDLKTNCANATGYNTTATGIASTAAGYNTQAIGNYSFAGGIDSVANGNSSFAYGTEISAFGENSFAIGNGSCAGAKGWYYKAVDTTNKKIYLTLTQRKPADIKFGSDIGLISPDTGFSVDESVVGKRICLVDKNKDDFGSTTVAKVEDNTVLVYNGELVNKAISSVDPLDYDDYSVIISEAPDIGLIECVSKNAFANGENVKASGRESHAEGRDTFAQGNYSHAEGRNTKALAYVTHAEGIDTIAGLYGTTGSYSHAEGNGVSAFGYTSHAEGYKTVASGSTSHSEGNTTEALGAASHAEGYKTTASGDYSHAEGGFDKTPGGSATGAGSHAEGMQTLASGIVAHAEGNQTEASASGAHAEGLKSVASGNYSHAEGNATSAMVEYSHAEGNGSVVYGLWSHAEGYLTSAFGNYSHAEGRLTIAGKVKDGTIAASHSAHAEGLGTKALGVASHASGLSVDVPDDYAFAWNGNDNKVGYTSHGIGTFNINPKNSLSGFYIGNDNFIQCVLSAVQAMNSTQKATLKTALGL